MVVILLSTLIIYLMPLSWCGNVSRNVVLFYCLGATLETMGEPWYNMYNSHFQMQPRVRAESVALTLKCVVTFIAVVKMELGVMGFGLAQVIYGASYLCTLILYYKLPQNTLTLSDYLPSIGIFSSNGHSLFDSDSLSVAFSMTGTTILKHLLTEADKITLTVITSTTSNEGLNISPQKSFRQGIYAICSNYSSLVTRMIYFPIEDLSRITFSKLSNKLISHTTNHDSSNNNSNNNSSNNSKSEKLVLSFDYF
jgi:oligosaccharide translocation protein RFT1